jgi:hypothetical protein
MATYQNLGLPEESQAQVIERLFIIPAARDNETDCLKRLQELFQRDTFDEDCAEFHSLHHGSGLDFAKCWVGIHHPADEWMGAYEKILDDHNLAPGDVLKTKNNN